jgi:hypothetical protein
MFPSRQLGIIVLHAGLIKHRLATAEMLGVYEKGAFSIPGAAIMDQVRSPQEIPGIVVVTNVEDGNIVR